MTADLHAAALDEDERREFVAVATSFLEANAERLPAAESFTWGRGPEVRLMGKDDEDPRALIAQARAWRAKVFDAGFGWLGGPVEYGGGGRHHDLDGIYRSLESEFDVPDQSAWGVAWEMVAPAILVHGNEDVKQRYLSRIYRGELLCSQLLSEPGNGSDLAGLRTKAVRDGDEWVVNGQKVWSSYAHLAELGQLMARTDPDAPKHKGLTMFLLPMDTPGVEPRPLRQMNGNAEFNEVFLTDVRVPDGNRVGDAGRGWAAVLTTLMSERAAVGSGKTSAAADPALILVELARHMDRLNDAVVRQTLAEVLTHRKLIEWVGARGEALVASGQARGAEGSILKLLSSRQIRRIATLAGSLLGPAFGADTGEWGTFAWSDYLCSTPGLRIAGGTDEIQHNILGERILGLPKEPHLQ
ncbi:MAG: acyl-CoA dehydrogenase [Actinobacteria bacterium]|uniref:Unannotated protein n=1 Tax=freshwater metagenome TaxID=449393 RepID=A0A6J6S8S6_9ZZZZ|nr:acyl-CoA dehydrogenase [Actinomycetota bacterium]